MYSKTIVEPPYAKTETVTRTGKFLPVLGYSIMAMVSYRCELSYAEIEKIKTRNKEVVYMNGVRSPVN